MRKSIKCRKRISRVRLEVLPRHLISTQLAPEKVRTAVFSHRPYAYDLMLTKGGKSEGKQIREAGTWS